MLARFLLEHALNETYADTPSRSRLELYRSEIESAFRALLETIFDGDFYERLQDAVTFQLVRSTRAMAEHPPPISWHVLASVTTGIDYAEEGDLGTLVASCMNIPELLSTARRALRGIVR